MSPSVKNPEQSWHHNVENTPKILLGGDGVLVICILWFVHPSKHIRENSPNRPKFQKFKILVLIEESENTIWRISGVSNVYTFSRAYFEAVEFYTARRYVNLKRMEYKKNYLSMSNRNKMMKCCQFLRHLCWYNTGLMVGGFRFTMFGFRAKLEPHFQRPVIYPAPRNACWWWKCPSSWEHSIWGYTASKFLQFEIRSNRLPKAIKPFIPHLCGFQKLFSWGGNEDEKVGAIFDIISCSM